MVLLDSLKATLGHLTACTHSFFSFWPSKKYFDYVTHSHQILWRSSFEKRRPCIHHSINSKEHLIFSAFSLARCKENSTHRAYIYCYYMLLQSGNWLNHSEYEMWINILTANPNQILMFLSACRSANINTEYFRFDPFCGCFTFDSSTFKAIYFINVSCIFFAKGKCCHHQS